MKICFISRGNPADRRSFSGISYNLLVQLRKSHEVEWIGEPPIKNWEKLYMKIQGRVYRLFGRRTSVHSKFFTRRYGQRVSRKLKNTDYDLLFAPAASECIAYLETDKPIVYLSDATFEALVGYYPHLTNLTARNIADGNRVEGMAIQKAWQIVYSSRWAADSAVKSYRADRNKISVIDFGANLLRTPPASDINKALDNRECCHLLFIGVHWLRKGGEKAYKVFLKLKESGVLCKLTIVGCDPGIENSSGDVVVIPFLDKNREADFARFYNIFVSTHFFILPTVADCTPIVFSEAAAFGVPVLTSDTGGIPSVIKEGVNGFMFPVEAGAEVYEEKIRSLWQNPERYAEMRSRCRAEFDNRLNWEEWNRKFELILNKLPTTHSKHPVSFANERKS